jgi:hypothetical protein
LTSEGFRIPLDTIEPYLYNLSMKLRNKFPTAAQVAQVFAVASIMIYGWTTYRLIQKLPSWLYYLNFKEILSNTSYTLVFDFVETLLFVGMILLLNFLLPKKFFLDFFVARGSLLSIFGLGYLIYLALAVGASKATQFPMDMFRWAPLVFLVILALAIFLPRIETVRKVTEDFANRAVIFLYILLPLTSLGTLIFIVNNLL